MRQADPYLRIFKAGVFPEFGSMKLSITAFKTIISYLLFVLHAKRYPGA